MHNLHKLDPTTEPKKKLQHDLKIIPVFNGMNFISLSLGGPTKCCEQICGGVRLRSSFWKSFNLENEVGHNSMRVNENFHKLTYLHDDKNAYRNSNYFG